MNDEMIKLDSLKRHPDNPRSITQEAIEELKVSVQELNKMFELRPICYDEDRIIWGGNQRHLILEQLGYKEIPKSWTKEMIDWTLSEKKAFAIKDNVSVGEWDHDKVQTDYWKAFAEEYGDREIKDLFKHFEDDNELPDELIGEEKNKPAIVKITFKSPEQLKEADEDISILIEKYEGSFYSISAGEV